MEVLAPANHSLVAYEPFRKQFYSPHPDIAALTPQEVAALRGVLQVRVESSPSAPAVPAPVRSFMQVGVDRKMLKVLMSLGLEAPTPIQAQSFPIAMSGRDMIGIAKTGSGKTLAFTLPMVRHVMDQRELSKGEGPIAVVLSPTRELAHQIFTQARKFLLAHNAECASVYGGVGKWEQIQVLKRGAEVVVATPGRLIEMIRKKHAPMNRVTFVVLDEADRMFEMGFEAQLRSIMTQIRPDRQTLMFSATFRKRIQALALDVLTNPVTLTIGRAGQANEEIRQIPIVLPNDNAKWPWLMNNLPRIASEGRVLIFASSKAGCEELTKNLNATSAKFGARSLHGDKTQPERSEALSKFKSGECAILVATDVAARGLDVKEVKSVVNFDVAKNIDIHVHRIGRTGRMGTEGFEPGTAYTLVTNRESSFASQLVQNLDVSGQQVSPELLALAQRDPRFRRGRPSGANTAQIPSAINRAPRQHESTMDAEDAAELQRWNESGRKRKMEQRRGLGFAPSVAGPIGGKKTLGMFVKASSASEPGSTTAAPPVFQASFVKATDEQTLVPIGTSAATAAPIPSSIEAGEPQIQTPSKFELAVLATNTVPSSVGANGSGLQIAAANSCGFAGRLHSDSSDQRGRTRESRSPSRSRRSRERSRRHSPSRSRSRGRRYRRSRSRSRSSWRRRYSRSSSRSSSRSPSRDRHRYRRRSRSRSSSRSRNQGRRSRDRSRSRSRRRR